MLPAQAGVIPTPCDSGVPVNNAPRAGGGDPVIQIKRQLARICSPRRRG